MWKRISINENLIKTDTGKSVLIAMPHSSEYDGYKFWHPSKLVRDGYEKGKVSISYTEDFVFRLKKYGNGKYNKREVLDEVQLAWDEIEAIFSEYADDYEPQEPEIYTPDHIEPEGATADESLVDND